MNDSLSVASPPSTPLSRPLSPIDEPRSSPAPSFLSFPPPYPSPPPYTTLDSSPSPSLSATARVLAEDLLECPPSVRALVLSLCDLYERRSPSSCPSAGAGGAAGADAAAAADADALALAISYIVRTAQRASAVRGMSLTLLNYVVMAFATSLLCWAEVAAAEALRSSHCPLLGVPLGILFILLVPVTMVVTRYERVGRSASTNGLVWLVAGAAPLLTAAVPILSAWIAVPTTRLRSLLADAVMVSAASLLVATGTALVLGYDRLGGELPTLPEFITLGAREVAHSRRGIPPST